MCSYMVSFLPDKLLAAHCHDDDLLSVDLVLLNVILIVTTVDLMELNCADDHR